MKAAAKGKGRRSTRQPKKHVPPGPSVAKKSAEKQSRRGWFALLIFAWGLAIYWPALWGGFVLDDYDLRESFSTVRTGEAKSAFGSGRPLLMLTYVLNHRLSGFDPFSFHLTNILLHCLNALILWRFLAALFSPGRFDDLLPSRFRPVVTYGLPLLFLASPIQTESVAYISSRSEVLSAAFYLLALWVFVSPIRERRPWLTAALVMLLFGCTALSKQDKLTLPFVIVMLDYLLLSKCDWRKMKPNWPTYALFLGGIVAGFVVIVRPFLFAPTAGFNLPWVPYLLTQFRMHFLYMRLAFAPFGLNADYDITPSHSLGEHLSWLALIGLIVLIGAVVYYHRRAPLIAFGTLFFFVVLAPTSSFFPILDYAAERRLYLPVIGLLLAALAGLDWLFRPSTRSAFLVLAAVLATYSLGAFQRSRVWSDELALWQDTAAKSPGKYRPWTWLGKVYNDMGMHTEAIHAWERAEKLVEPGSRDHAHLLNNLGLAYANLKNRARAVEYYQKAVELRPREPQFWANLAVVQLRLGREKEGWESFANAVKRGPNRPEVFLLRGQEYFQAGRYQEAAADFREALRLRPEDETARKNLRAAETMLKQSQDP